MKKQIILRFAPSPTGQLHIGNIGTCLAGYMLARSMGGKFYLRIEDTDQVREVKGAAEQMIEQLKDFGFEFDGEILYQSRRGDIYKKYADELVKKGLAYHDEGAIRFKAPPKEIIQWTDLVKGDMKLPGLERDPVIMKSNGLPPYNLANTLDDHLCGVTHVTRGEDWLPSTAEHIQLERALGFKPRQYAHFPNICIIDVEDGNKRKLSKRKDKEALVENFLTEGYPKDALIEYLLTLYNTDYELWRTANPKKNWREFNFRFEKIGSNSPLFDWDKLNNISGNIIANMTCEQVMTEVKSHFGSKLTDKQYADVCTLLCIDRGTDRPRKDIVKYNDILTEFDYILKPVKMTKLLEQYKTIVAGAADKDQWFEKVKSHCEKNNLKVRDYTQSIRVALTGREKSTDLYTISRLLLR